MSRIEKILTQIEARLRLIIEGDGSQAGFPSKLHRALNTGLIAAMRSGVREHANGCSTPVEKSTAPDQYTLVLPMLEAQALLTHPTELDRLTRSLERSAMQAGLSFARTPIVRVVADPQIEEMKILVEYCQPGVDDSHTYPLEGSLGQPGVKTNGALPAAFLIVNGITTFSINQPVVNIGRDPANQLRLNNPRISPRHAQLRYVQGQFVIFDLDSRAGTYVNGVIVSSHALKPGDVIQLAGVPLVYGQETSLPAGQTQELPVVLPPPEVL